MKCKDIQDELLLSGKTAQMNEHLSSCEECVEFSKIVEGMNDMELPGPSAVLDAKVLDFARNNRPSAKKPIPFYILTAVAALIIVAFSILSLNKGKVQDNGFAETEKNEKSIDLPKEKVMVADSEQEKNDLDSALDTLWDDDVMSADITAIEGELFVLSAELYSN